MNPLTRPTMQRCPACGHAGEFITLHHMRKHGVRTRDEFERTYGHPIEMDARLPQNVRVWAREASNDYHSRAYRQYIGIS